MSHKDAHEKLTAWVPEDHVEALKVEAKLNGRSLASEVRMALAAWLRQKESAA